MKASRIPELDGLRGVAILLVLAAHIGAGAAPANRLLFSWWNGGGGGLVGVQLFFVLSGYLITGILLRELESKGTISFRGFYLRRVRRLVPALVLICAALAIGSLIWTGGVRGTVTDIVLALTYTSNLAVLAYPLFHVHIHQLWLGHTWSLAVEEQFYLAWPITMFLAARRGRVCVLWVALVGAGVTILTRALLPVPPDYMYKLLRWDSLLLGCALAVVPLRVPRPLGWLGWIVILGYAVLPARPINALDFTVTTVACVLVLARALDNRFLRNPVLMWFGTISYGLYLWHVLILRFGPQAFVGAAISIAIAAISYYLVERRFLRPAPLSRAPRP